MRSLVSRYLTMTMEPLPEDITQEPFETVALSRMIDQMIRHIQSAQKQQFRAEPSVGADDHCDKDEREGKNRMLEHHQFIKIPEFFRQPLHASPLTVKFIVFYFIVFSL
jgi:hypothetical protein